ncbi:RidA family protein [Thauera chlorobenzoica]|uniref:Enamine deaminase RidA n=1 Tax=Thauera chlorobenzoica TaxID=96773 RepID=A0A1H5XA62_9RHOO|nr:RidA family protein [Thauera chlorobenzoica]APR04738.1 enamine deaminase RidA [Thauera chlorobenzoica]SEG08654.1 Enamine deaminase RidA, house cleaning of reactive enamine intermediates, YjgF/YER057c/UK114 family [Thauera chlorobenzoica]
MQVLQPPGWKRPKGYSNGIIASGRTVFVAGQVGWDEQEVFRTDDLVGQIRQALTNIVAILAAGGARPEHIVRMNWFLADAAEYNTRLAEIGEVYRELIGRHFPVMMALQVAGFVEHGAKVEIEVTAMLPE